MLYQAQEGPPLGHMLLKVDLYMCGAMLSLDSQGSVEVCLS